MSNLTRAMMMGAAGVASGDSVYVDDVFSTHLYVGTSSAGHVITNGIDLDGEGGAVWVKNRGATDHHLITNEAGKFLTPSSDEAEFTNTGFISSFNSNGFTLGQGVRGSNNGDGQVSWTFRKAPGFFDVVTYTGNQTTRTIAHNLGSVPGMVVVKKTSGSGSWEVYHRSTGNEKTLRLNSSNAQAGTTAWNDTTPTSTHFTLSSSTDVNETGSTYIAYIFAHDDQSFGTDGDESIIKCGSYTGNGSATGPTIDLGFEPQWVILKPSSGSGHWQVYDTMRGWTDGGKDKLLYANLTASEDDTNTDMIKPFSTGFQLTANFTGNSSGVTYIYMAIRRPHKTPGAGTEVFNTHTVTDGGTNYWTPGFAPDFLIETKRNTSAQRVFASRMTGNSMHMMSDSTAAETGGSNNYFEWDSPTGQMKQSYFQGSADYLRYTFKRAPGFMDVVTYKGDGSSNRQISHNLDAVPELLIVKQRDATREWAVYSAATGVGKFLKLRENVALTTQSGLFDTAPTSSIFTVETNTYVNINSGNYIAYLFATLPGISKVGSYTGTGNAINVDCGFTNGARFVLIKRADVGGDWDVMDSVRGIAIGNDKHIALNVTTAEGTSSDFIDPLNAGFTVSAAAPNDINQSGGTYIFLAIA
jgi:hypothetical protein